MRASSPDGVERQIRAELGIVHILRHHPRFNSQSRRRAVDSDRCEHLEGRRQDEERNGSGVENGRPPLSQQALYSKQGRQMARHLITTPFPSLADDAKILGLSKGEKKQVNDLMDKILRGNGERSRRRAHVVFRKPVRKKK